MVREERSDGWLPGRRTALVVAAGFVPWVAIPYDSGTSLVFSFGLVNPSPIHVQSVLDYLSAAGRVPAWLFAWPVATLLYTLALASHALALIDREDRRVTAGLLALAGLDVLYFSYSFSSYRLGIVALPVGTAALWLAAWASLPGDWLARPDTR